MSPKPRTNTKRGDRSPNYQREIPRRRSLGGEQVEGRQAVRELIRTKSRTVEYIWIEDTVIRKGIIAEIVDLALSRRIPLITVSRRRFDSVVRSEGSQGILAKAAALREMDLAELVTVSQTPFLVVIDGITDPHNLGAILRSAELSGVTGIILPQNRTTLVTPTVAKAASGAIEYLNFALVPGIPSALRDLAEMGIFSIGLDIRGNESIYDVSNAPLGGVALVLGAEDKGIARLTAERCDKLVRIPQFGKLDSLNVSSAAAIALFEIARARSNK